MHFLNPDIDRNEEAFARIVIHSVLKILFISSNRLKEDCHVSGRSSLPCFTQNYQNHRSWYLRVKRLDTTTKKRPGLANVFRNSTDMILWSSTKAASVIFRWMKISRCSCRARRRIRFRLRQTLPADAGRTNESENIFSTREQNLSSRRSRPLVKGRGFKRVSF